MITTIGVMGGGAWGTALAVAAARAGRQVVLWARDGDTVAAINERRENVGRMPGTALPAAITSGGPGSRASGTSLAIGASPRLGPMLSRVGAAASASP